MSNKAFADIFRNATKELLTEDDLSVGKIYSEYQRKPVAFGNEILKNKYTKDIEKLMYSVLENEITVAESANAVGKTHAAADIAIWFYKCYPGSQVFVLCAPPEDNLKKLFWAELLSRMQQQPGLFVDDTIQSLEVKRKGDAKSFIAGVTIPTTGTEKDREAKVSGKHAPYLLFITDEADAIPTEIFRGIESCMSGGFARLLLLHNPRQKKGKPYEYVSRGKANVIRLSAFNHPNVIEGKDVIPGAVRQDVTIRRIIEWTRPAQGADEETNPNAIFEVPWFLVGKEVVSTSGEKLPALDAGKRLIIDPSFHYMVLGQYPDVIENQLIQESWMTAANERHMLFQIRGAREYISRIRPTLGLDVAEFGDDKSILCVRYGNYVSEFFEWGNRSIPDLCDEVAYLYHQLQACEIFVDSTGLGASVPSLLRRAGCEMVHRIVYNKSPTTEEAALQFENYRAQMWWNLRVLHEENRIMYPPDDLLQEELKKPMYFKSKRQRIEVSNSKMMKTSLGRSLDRANALALAFAIPQEEDIGYLGVIKYA